MDNKMKVKNQCQNGSTSNDNKVNAGDTLLPLQQQQQQQQHRNSNDNAIVANDGMNFTTMELRKEDLKRNNEQIDPGAESLEDSNSKMSYHINMLPDEMLEFILTYLPPYKDLESCSLVCKRWRDIVKSKL